MFNYFRKELDWGGRKLILETGKIARQADGAVLARYGDTIVLCTAVGVKSSRPGQTHPSKAYRASSSSKRSRTSSTFTKRQSSSASITA